METSSSTTLREMPATFRAIPTFAPFTDTGFLGACFTKSGDVDIAYLADLFRMSKAQLAETVGLPLATVIKTNRMKAPKAQGRMTEMLEIIARIKDWAGSDAQAMAWYRSQPIPALDGRTAESLVKSGDAAAVRDYLDHMALGGFA
ncbi:antitoxin Xre/MbcA/ParS toxin-binding domain-containing protein [Sphingorhabdus sp.]|uniref:antitoxin Xre/MbcA/ParS toxin-binding domain-containing protein n=1 Tax=Sphingorhabdus sp. TaxID=1902408 RepID=UPI003592EB1D